MDNTFENFTTDIGQGDNNVPMLSSVSLISTISAFSGSGGIYVTPGANTSASTSLLLFQQNVAKTDNPQGPQINKFLIFGTIASLIVLVYIL